MLQSLWQPERTFTDETLNNDLNTIKMMCFCSISLWLRQMSSSEMTSGIITMPAPLQLPKSNDYFSPRGTSIIVAMKMRSDETICDKNLSLSHIHTHWGGCGDVNSGVDDAAGVPFNFQWMYHPPPPGGKMMTTVCEDVAHDMMHQCAERPRQHVKTYQGDETNIAAHSCNTTHSVKPMRRLTVMSSTDRWSSFSTDYSRKVRLSRTKHTFMKSWLQTIYMQHNNSVQWRRLVTFGLKCRDSVAAS